MFVDLRRFSLISISVVDARWFSRRCSLLSIVEALEAYRRIVIESLSHAYRTSIKNLSNTLSSSYRKSIGTLTDIYRISIEHRSTIYLKSIEHHIYVSIFEGFLRSSLIFIDSRWFSYLLLMFVDFLLDFHCFPSSWLWENIIESSSKVYRISIEHLSKALPNIENISNFYRSSIEILSNIYRKSIENRSSIYRTSVGHL